MKNTNNSSKKLTYKEKVSLPKQEPAAKSLNETGLMEFSTKKIYALIIAFSFLLYGNTLFNDFVLDDGIVITKNDFTKNGIAGIPDIFKYDTFAGEHGTDVKLVAGGRYRPFTVAMFAIEYELFGENPAFFHFFNIVLYALTGILLYMILFKLFALAKIETAANQAFAKRWYFSVPVVTTLLFLAHPIHTEAVANIKGRDEIMTLLGALFATYMAIKHFETKKVIYLVWIFVGMFVGLLSKENAITFLVITPAALYFFAKAKLSKALVPVVPMLLATFIFLIIRNQVLGYHDGVIPRELMNDPFVDATWSQKWGTILYTLGIYIKLLIFPHPLTWDYYPYHIPLVALTDIRAWGSFLIYLLLGVWALFGLYSRSVYSFAILVFIAALSPVSNIFFAVGTFMSERFVYISSIGFLLAVSYYFFNQFPKKQLLNKKLSEEKLVKGLGIGLLVVLVLFSLKTIMRNFDWKDNFTLFTTDVKVSKNSAKGNTTAGEQYVIRAGSPKYKSKKDEYIRLSKEHLKRAIEIHPLHIAAVLDMGVAYEKNNEFETAIDYYLQTARLNPTYDKAFTNIVNVILTDSVDKEFQLKVLDELYKLNPNRLDVNYLLGSLYGPLRNDADKVILHLEKALEYKQDAPKIYSDLALAYGIKGNMKKAVENIEKALALNPQGALIYENAVRIFSNAGMTQKANEAAEKARKIASTIQ